MKYQFGSAEYLAYKNGYKQAVQHGLHHGPAPEMPEGYTPSQCDAWLDGKCDGYQET